MKKLLKKLTAVFLSAAIVLNVIPGLNLALTANAAEIWAKNDLPTAGNYFTDVVYGNGKFLTADYNTGNIYTSTNGENWSKTATLSNSPDAASIMYATFADGKFVLSSSNNVTNPRMFYSADGSTWTTTTILGKPGGLMGVTYGNSCFAVVGSSTSSSTICTSPDAAVWTIKFSMDGLDLTDIAFGNGTYVAVGAGGKMVSSSDAENWTAVASTGTTNDLKAITYANNLFVAVGDGGTIITSSNGTTWTSRTTSTTNTLYNIQFTKGKFYAVGLSGTALVSADGITWAAETVGTTNDLLGVVGGAGKLVVVGSEVSYTTVLPNQAPTAKTTVPTQMVAGTGTSSFSASDIAEDSDGDALTVTAIKTAPDSATATAAIDSGKVTLTGVAPGTTTAVVTVSDGTDTVDVTVPITVSAWTKNAFSSGLCLQDAVYGNGIFLTVDFNNGDVYTSSNGISWSKSSTLPNSPQAAYVVYASFLEGKFILTEYNNLGNPRVFYSTDGITWTTVSTTPSSKTMLCGMTYGNSKYVMVGDNGSTSRIFVSSDLNSWTQVFCQGYDTGTTSLSLTEVAFGNNAYVAVGSGGQVFTSSDTTNWQKNSSNTTENLSAITYANNLFVAVGYSGTIITSPNGVTWTSRTSNTTQNLCNVNFIKGKFYAVGDGGTMLVSADGVTWTAEAVGTTSTLYGVIGGGGNLVTVGDGVSYTSVLTNQKPTAKTTVPTQSITGKTAINFSASDIAEDSDGDALTVTAIKTAPASATATAAIDSGKVTVTGCGAGATSVIVTVSDGTDTVDVTVPITVTMPISTAAIVGVTAPVTGAVPVSSLVDTSEYSASISWTPADTTFKPKTIYTATIAITPKTGYTLTGVAANSFQVAGATTTNEANSGAVTATFPATPAVAPTATTAAASFITSTAATLSGTVNANNEDTTVTFEYGTTDSYGTIVTASPSKVTGTSAASVSCSLSGLTPNTTYHFRVKSVNSTGTTYGSDNSFTTKAIASTATTSAATSITSTSATLNGAVNANNTETTVTFEYGITDSYGTTVTASPSPVTGTTATSVTNALSGLTPNTTYYYRVVGSNAAGTTDGSSMSFTTKTAAPTAATSAATDITLTAATLSGAVNANNADTTVTFEYGITDSYGTTVTASPSLVTGTATTSVTYALSGLTPNTTYHFRVKSVNSAGTTYGSDNTFTTKAAAPGVPVLSVTAGDGSVHLSWDSVSGATDYKIYQGTESGVYGSIPVADVAGTSTTISSGLTNGTAYYFVVRATNAGGDSANSNEVSATPQIKAEVQSVSAANGTVSIVLDKVPTFAPTAANFTATSKIDGNAENSLPLSSFAWNEGTKTVTFSFVPIAQAVLSQSVVIAVSYKGAVSVSAAAFTVAGASAVNKILNSISNPDAITGVANGAAKTAAALGLPKTAVLSTDKGSVTADVNWNVDGCTYDKSKTTAQTFTVSGTVTLPAGVVNSNSIPLTVTISVTVKAASGGEAGKDTVTGFILDYTTKTVPYGTDFASLNLPDKIKAVGNEISGLWVKVSKWICSAFDPTVPDTYTATAVLDSGYVDSGYVDSGYVLGSGVSAPKIKITVAASSSSNSNNHSDSSSSKTSSSTASTAATETKVDTVGNTATVTTKPQSVTTSGNTTDIAVTIPSVTFDNIAASTNGNTVDMTKKTTVTINLPAEEIKQQFTAKKDVELAMTVPSEVAKDTSANLAVTINAGKDIFEAAKQNQADLTIKIKDADTQQLAYSWTFKGEDLAKSTVPVTDVNIAMSVHLTTEVPKVNVITPENKGLVLSFDHSGKLPSTASVKISALQKGFKPGDTLYFYYYNPTTKQIDPLGSKYLVDSEGFVTVQIDHCSDYVLLPNAIRSITLDTRSYTMAPKKSYEIGVKLTGVTGATVKAYSSTKGVASVARLKNGNYKVTALKPGLTYIMLDVYDSKNKFLTHASVRVTVQNGVKANGNSSRQFGTF